MSYRCSTIPILTRDTSPLPPASPPRLAPSPPAPRSYRSAYIPGASATAETPVLVHFNYHPDKHARMLCIMDRWGGGMGIDVGAPRARVLCIVDRWGGAA